MPTPEGSEMLAWFEEIAYKEYKSVYNLCWRLTQSAGMDRSFADDLVQQVFFTARTKLCDFYGHPKPRAWLYQTARYIFSNALRKHRYQRKMQAMSLDDEKSAFIEFSDPAALAEMEAWMPAEEPEFIRGVIRKLSPKDQLLYQQLYVSRRDADFLCGYYGINETAIKKRIYRLHKRLLERMEKKL